ncbi:unnamed protein product [Rhizoctonia solani]|uniref:Uncharacterized protein n=1 Tax=Rhizoctonia solani TaxID=456999 RepID=A0A8H2XCI6_9AGAM|nr:unnamed protein product [Rhizoctonia solani]
MKNILAIVASFILLSPAVFASPAVQARECSSLGGKCGEGYMVPKCCGGSECSYASSEGGPGADKLKVGKMKIGKCIEIKIGTP